MCHGECVCVCWLIAAAAAAEDHTANAIVATYKVIRINQRCVWWIQNNKKYANARARAHAHAIRVKKKEERMKKRFKL